MTVEQGEQCATHRVQSGRRVVVVGGGIAGLAAALMLQTQAPDLETMVLEADPEIGGKIRTSRLDGFVVEGGPDSFLSSKPAGMELARQIGIADRLEGVRQETRRTFVMYRGRLVQLPEGLSGLVPARLGPLFRSPLLSPRGKLRVAMERWMPTRRSDGDESLGSFMRRRMGSEAYERLIQPLMSGIYGGNGDDISLEATFPRLRDLERSHGSILRALRSAPAPSPSSPASPFVAPVGGMAELVRAVEQHLCAGSVRTSCAVRRLTWDGARYSLEAGDETLQADAVILATPSDVSAHLLAGVDVEVAGLLAEIRYAPAATVSLGFRTRDLAARPEGHGYVIPRREGRPVLAVTWSSNKFAGRAPAGHLLVRGFFGQPESAEAVRAEDSELVRLLQAELRSTAGIAADPVVSAVHRWPNAMPQYAVGHPERIAAIEHELASHPGLALAGAAYRGVGIPDCIQSGRRAADLVLDCVTRGMR